MSTDADQSIQPVGLATHSARGLVYLFASSTVAKLVSFSSYIVLGYLLSEGDFGVFGLACTITAFIQVIEQGGVGDVLVRRKRLRPWAIPAFWLAACLGVLSCLLIAAAAPIASALFGNRQLFWMLLILAPASLPNALAVVPRAQLARELRFRALAAINLASLTVRLGMTVAFAALGFGP